MQTPMIKYHILVGKNKVYKLLEVYYKFNEIESDCKLQTGNCVNFGT